MQLSMDQRYKVIFYFVQGLSALKIAEKMGIYKTSVYKIIKKYKENGDLSHRRQKNRQKGINNSMSTEIKKMIQENPKISLRKIVFQLREGKNFDVSYNTLKCHLNYL